MTPDLQAIKPDGSVSPAQARAPLTARQVLLGAAAVLAGIGLMDVLALASGSPLAIAMAGPIGPILILVVCTLCGLLLVLADRDFFWTPLLWMLAMCALFFGIGPLVYWFGNDASITWMDLVLEVRPHQHVRTNLLNIAGIVPVLVGAAMVRLPIADPRTMHSFQQPRVGLIGIGFWVAGAGWSEVLIGPMLNSTDLVGSGWMLYPQHLASAGIVLMAAAASRHRRWIPILLLTTAASMVFGAMALDKSRLLIAFGAVFLGLYLGNKQIRMLLVGAVLAVPVYLVASPVVSSGRIELSHRTGDYSRGTASERASVLFNGVVAGHAFEFAEIRERQGAWTRLSYVNMQALVMDHYDRGVPGDTYSDLPWVFVPRIIAPQKPALSDVGRDLRFLAVGDDLSFFGVGVFGEAYWNGGWPLVILTCLSLGLVYGVVGRVSLHIVRTGNTLFLPLVLFGALLGYHIDRSIGVSVAGLLVYWLLGAMALGGYRILTKARMRPDDTPIPNPNVEAL